MKKLLVIILILILVNYANSQVPVQDSLALVSLYNSTNGDNWHHQDHWLQAGMPVGNWYGVTVQDHRVSRINLDNNNLAGDIPGEIGNLDSLSFLDLSADTIYSLPIAIGNLTTLDTLALFSSVIDTIPAEIGNLQDLKYFNFSYTKIRYLPEETEGLTKLEYLLGSHGKLRNIPENIGNLTFLKVIDLQVNEIANLPNSIGNCTNLIELHLNANMIPEIPSEIGSLTNLEQLILGRNNLNRLPDEIFTLTNLKSLNFAANNLDSIPPEIGNLTNLTNLQFFENEFTFIPEEFGNLINLTYIVGNFNRLNSLPLSLLNLQNVYIFYLGHNSLTFDDIEPLVSINGIEYETQDSIGRNIDTTAALNSAFRLECITGGQFNRYKWLKNGDTIGGADEYFLEWPNLTYADTGEYRCVVTNTLATELTLFSKPTRLHVVDLSGFSEPDQDNAGDFTIYPNPAKDRVYITIKEIIPRPELEIIIYNSYGDIIKKHKAGIVNPVEIDIPDLCPGTYFIRLVDTLRNKSHLKKIIVL